MTSSKVPARGKHLVLDAGKRSWLSPHVLVRSQRRIVARQLRQLVIHRQPVDFLVEETMKLRLTIDRAKNVSARDVSLAWRGH